MESARCDTFDSVPHKRLIKKLRTFGIKGKVLNWIKDILTARIMKVTIRGVYSMLNEVLSRIPKDLYLGRSNFCYLSIIYRNGSEAAWRCLHTTQRFDQKSKHCHSAKHCKRISIRLLTGLRNGSLDSTGMNAKLCMWVTLSWRNTTSDEQCREELQSIQEERDLEVLIRSDFKPNTQCVQVAAKAKKIIRKSRRHFRRL